MGELTIGSLDRLLLAEIDDGECKYHNRGPTDQKLSDIAIDDA
jgi:hypothetical protein